MALFFNESIRKAGKGKLFKYAETSIFLKYDICAEKKRKKQPILLQMVDILLNKTIDKNIIL